MASSMPASSHIPRCTEGIKPDNNGWVPSGTCGYHGKMYYPSFFMAVIFSALAGTIFLGHVIQLIRYPTSWLQKFALFISACLLAGYIARTVGTRHQQNIYITAFSDTMVLVSPTLISALDYMIFIAMTRVYEFEFRIGALRLKFISWPIIAGISLFTSVQLITCAMIVTGNPTELQVAGIQIYMGSIAIQGASVLCLFALTLEFNLKISKINIFEPRNYKCSQGQALCMALYFSMVPILLRAGYRLVELSQVFQSDKTLPHKEIFFYVFEAVPILASLSVWTIVSMGKLNTPSSKKREIDYQEPLEHTREETIPLTSAAGE